MAPFLITRRALLQRPHCQNSALKPNVLVVRRVAVLISLFLLLTACKKENDPPAVVGTIAGIVVPAGAITQVQVINTTGYVAGGMARSGADGSFRIDRLPPGIYRVSFTSPSQYAPPATQMVKVAADSIYDMGTILVPLRAISSITGIVTPVDAITQVQVTSSFGSVARRVATPGADGLFRVDSLVSGIYTVSFTPAWRYYAPAERTVVVENGKTTTLGTIPVLMGTMSFRVDGVSLSADDVTSSLTPGNAFGNDILTITGLTSAAQQLTLTIRTNGGLNLGIYPCQEGTTPGTASGTWREPGGDTWTTDGLQGGTIVVQNVTVNTWTFQRTISGTFSFTAAPVGGGASGNRLIIGSFDAAW